MIQTILVPFDFSPSATRALRYALTLTERTGAHLHVRHIQEIPLGPLVGGEPSPMPEGQQLQQVFEDRCRDELSEQSFPPDDRLSFSLEQSGDVAPALVQFAEKTDVDLVAMGTHGRRGVKRVFFGSTAEEVLRTAPCPVLTTRTEDEAEEGRHSPASVERLVVPVDFSKASRGALQYAARLSEVYEAPLALVHVVNLPALPAAYEIDFTDTDARAVEERARDHLQEWGRFPEVESQIQALVVESGDPASTILDIASEPEDLIVMATRGLSGLKRTMLGSVAENVLRRAPGPVLTGRTFGEGDGE